MCLDNIVIELGNELVNAETSSTRSLALVLRTETVSFPELY